MSGEMDDATKLVRAKIEADKIAIGGLLRGKDNIGAALGDAISGYRERDNKRCADGLARAVWLTTDLQDRAEKAESQVSSLTAEVAVLVGALEFYADPESYFGVSVFADRPCGGFADDYSETETELGVRHGKLARETLANTSEAAKAMGEVVEAAIESTRIANDMSLSDEMVEAAAGKLMAAVARLHAGRGAEK